MPEGFKKEDRKPYTDVATVESLRHDVIPEEFPDGPYGAATNEELLGKSEPWLRDQRALSNYAYENRQFHADLPRRDPPEHLTHDDPYREEEQP
jgi:hypothetical protein